MGRLRIAGFVTLMMPWSRGATYGSCAACLPPGCNSGTVTARVPSLHLFAAQRYSRHEHADNRGAAEVPAGQRLATMHDGYTMSCVSYYVMREFPVMIDRLHAQR